MEDKEIIAQTAIKNYLAAPPWPEHDRWHGQTYSAIKTTVEDWLQQFAVEGTKILNAGSGGTAYKTRGKMIHLDIVDKCISQYDEYLVGSIENIPLDNNSVDGIVCVGSVLNYTDAQRSIAEFARILKNGGFLILEFERSNSAEFLWTPRHGQYVFTQEYNYNKQTHLLWMYSEKHIRDLLKIHQFCIQKIKRIHSLSSLLYRIGISEENAASYAKFDALFQAISYPIAHNVIFLMTKEVSPECEN